MKVPLKWLKEYVDITVPQADLASKLTMAGSEVKGIQVIGGNLENIVIGQIVAVNPHPNADRLRLPTIDLGTEQITVVCGAPNLNAGDKIAFARVGARLIEPSNGQLATLTTAKIRGVVSSGMVCSEKEMGISDSHEGIMVLSPEAPVGMPLADYLGDTVFDLDVTPNRPDCLSVIGIAREAAALTGQKLHIPDITYEETEQPIDEQISIEIADPDLCSRYCATLITGVKIAESPKWMQERLLACGMRPINNVVDITNYVMLEYGQPLHAFDYTKIKGKKIIVRRAADGEVTVSLDEVERTLSSNTLVIADEERAVAIAGVMGGANSEVSEDTTSILLESANFNPTSIHYTSRHLSLISEASMRFERGIRPGLTVPALKHATQLIIQLGDGKAARGVADVYPGQRDPEPILLSKNEVKRILGIEFGLEQIADTLASLGFECRTAASSSEIWAIAPYWRSDISQAVDLIEEAARIIGYDQIPMTMLGQPLPRQNPEPVVSLKQKVRRSLVGYGFQEVITFSLTGIEMLNKLTSETDTPEPVAIRVANPMTAEQEYLRPNLRANLLSALVTNRRYEDGGIRLFELGKIYLPREGDLPAEPESLCCILNGSRVEKSWLDKKEEAFEFFDAKGMVEDLLGKLGVEAEFEPSTDKGLHPYNQAAIIIANNRLGVVGELHPEVSDAFEISEPIYLFEINISALLPFTIAHKLFQPIPRFPTTDRDIALVVDTKTTHREIQDIIRSFPLVKQVILFDVYSGEQVPPGKKSLAYRVVYQSPEHTLTEEEVTDVQQQILDRLSQGFGATLRT
ncbi:phenylalanine--tRNA ligase subunit beta [Chloroflexota bacterium]